MLFPTGRFEPKCIRVIKEERVQWRGTQRDILFLYNRTAAWAQNNRICTGRISDMSCVWFQRIACRQVKGRQYLLEGRYKNRLHSSFIPAFPWPQRGGDTVQARWYCWSDGRNRHQACRHYRYSAHNWAVLGIPCETQIPLSWTWMQEETSLLYARLLRWQLYCRWLCTGQPTLPRTCKFHICVYTSFPNSGRSGTEIQEGLWRVEGIIEKLTG